MPSLCPTCGGGIWPGGEITKCPDAFHQQGQSPKARVFVFGSNLRGVHGAGAALCALQEHGAIRGLGVGPQGDSYAIPTKDENIETLPLTRIKPFVLQFLDYARIRKDLRFQVTRIGCGLAGYTDTDIAPMFEDAPENCDLPPGWRP